MRKAIKIQDSTILTDNLKYVSGNSANNKKVAEILLKEQKNFALILMSTLVELMPKILSTSTLRSRTLRVITTTIGF